MKHATLSAFLLVGFGFSPFMGMLGGGNMNYGKAPAIQQSSNTAANTETKGTSVPRQKKTAENLAAGSCKNTEENACSSRDAQTAK